VEDGFEGGRDAFMLDKLLLCCLFPRINFRSPQKIVEDYDRFGAFWIGCMNNFIGEEW
jgi:hypothetical protein